MIIPPGTLVAATDDTFVYGSRHWDSNSSTWWGDGGATSWRGLAIVLFQPLGNGCNTLLLTSTGIGWCWIEDLEEVR